MLQIYPERLLDFAVDDVIQAASVQRANDAERIVAFARKRAAIDHEQARAEAQALRASANFEGYRAGLAQALASLQPFLDALHGEQVALSDAVSAQVHDALQSMAAAPDIVVEQVCAAFRARCDAADTSSRPVLHVPDEQAGLLDALRLDPRLAGLELRHSARQMPLLEVGPMAWQLDMAGVLDADIEQALSREMPALATALDAIAESYSQRLQQDIANAAQTRGFASLKDRP